jgi:hypothetical protein
MPDTSLGLFGHHPDKSADFCIEVEDLEGYAFEVRNGMNHLPGYRSQWPFWGRLSRALGFARTEADLDEIAQRAVPMLHRLEPYATGKLDIDFVAEARSDD